jgi:transposase
MTMPYNDAGTSGVQRFEVFTGKGRRRDWPPETKATIVAESYSGRETVCAVARRHGLAPSQLFTWRRELRKQLEDRGVTLPITPPSAPSFVPAVIDPLPANEPVPVARRSRKHRGAKASAVELEIDGVAVKIGHGADSGVIAAVIEALKRAR